MEGCLEAVLEAVAEVIIEGWIYLMQLIIPEKNIGKKVRAALRIVVVIVTVILFISMIIGFFALFSDDEYEKQAGRYLLFVPLGISVFQISAGILVRIISKKK